jgi:Flp pilus assembly protein TadD
MRPTARIAVLALLVGACSQTAQERVAELNEDGVRLYERGSYGHAQETFQVALSLQPNDPSLLYNLGRCYDQLGRADRAEDAYRRCLQADPQHGECRHSLIVLLTNTGRRPAAVDLVQGWLRQEPKRASPYVEDGWLMLQEGDLLSARGRLQQAVTLEPRNDHALLELGRLYERLNYPDRAVVMYERSLESNPHQPEVTKQVSYLRSQGVGRPHPE